MIILKLPLTVFALLVSGSPALSQTIPAEKATPAVAAKPAYSTNSTIGELLADPAAAAVLDKHLPGISKKPEMQTPQAAQLRFKALQQFAPQFVTDAVLAAIDADLAELPRK